MRLFLQYIAVGSLLAVSVPVHSQEHGLEPFHLTVAGSAPNQETIYEPRTTYRAAEAKLSENAFDPAAETLLRGMEAVTKSVFTVPSLHFEKAVTQQILSGPEWGDVLIAEWSVDEAFGKGSIILADTPYFSDYALRLSDCKIDSQADLTAFLHALMAWHGTAPLPGREAVDNAPGTTISVPPGFPAVPYFQGPRFGYSPFNHIADFYFRGLLQGKEWYLHFGIGKSRTANISKVPSYIPERFPPLADLVKFWGPEQIRREVGHEVKPFEATPAFTEGRDQVLIAELARRGLSDEQVADLLTDVRPSPRNYAPRLRTFIGGYTESGKGPWLAFLEPALKAYEGIGPAADAGVLELFSDAGRLSCPATVEQSALDTLKKGVFSRGPFAYLGKCSTSPQTIAALENLAPRDDTF